ncbi:MAG: hypothetical protein FWG13_00270 [Leptospirales bacterium]|nr:hypothetical protein [Leptospirales bacterium]
MKNKEIAIAAIRECKTRLDLDNVLDLFRITGMQETIDFLNVCMYNPQTFFSSEPITIEDEFEFTKQIFLTGTWRLNEYYDRMGIGKAGVNA